jgi:hypothetical protein
LELLPREAPPLRKVLHRERTWSDPECAGRLQSVKRAFGRSFRLVAFFLIFFVGMFEEGSLCELLWP